MGPGRDWAGESGTLGAEAKDQGEGRFERDHTTGNVEV